MPIPTSDCRAYTGKPTAADNYAEREAQVDEIVARIRRIELKASTPEQTGRA